MYSAKLIPDLLRYQTKVLVLLSVALAARFVRLCFSEILPQALQSKRYPRDQRRYSERRYHDLDRADILHGIPAKMRCPYSLNVQQKRLSNLDLADTIQEQRLKRELDKLKILIS